MKIKHQLILYGSFILLFLMTSSCGTSNGSRNCDCPKFGSLSQQPDIYFAAQESVSAIGYLE